MTGFIVDEPKIIEMRKLKYSIEAIGDVTGYSETTIFKTLRKHGLTGKKELHSNAAREDDEKLKRWAKAMPDS